MRAVLISIQPKWCELIANGKKTVEVRKTSPKLDTPFKCYIYCTLPPKSEFFWHHDEEGHRTLGEYANELIRLQDGRIVYDYGMRLCVDPEDRPYSQDNFLCKKVIGEFVCDKLIWVLSHPTFFAGHPLFYSQAIKDACLTEDDVESYSGGKDVYGWHISDLVIYDKPKELSEFSKHGFDHPVWLKRPPQSWCYVEERD